VTGPGPAIDPAAAATGMGAYQNDGQEQSPRSPRQGRPGHWRLARSGSGPQRRFTRSVPQKERAGSGIDADLTAVPLSQKGR